MYNFFVRIQEGRFDDSETTTAYDDADGEGPTTSGMNCIKIGLPRKLILGDYSQENRTSRRPFLLLRITFPGRPIFIQPAGGAKVQQPRGERRPPEAARRELQAGQEHERHADRAGL